jgi:hypothetical protein
MQQPPQHVIPTNNFTFGTYHNVPRPLSPRFSGSVPAQTYKYPNPVLMTNPVAPTPPPPSINPSQLGYQPNSQTFINSLGNSAKVINNINYSSVGQSNISTNPKSLAVSGSDPQNSHYNITPLNISNI